MARYTQSRGKVILLLFLFAAVFPAFVSAQKLSTLEQIPMNSYKGMREVERYQLKVAEKYYLKKEYKIAMDEYEKFLSLYEESTGAPYAQLMWSQCLVRLRKVNTAIREGFQSVVDYWPDSEEAQSAAYLIARSYQDIGDIGKAKAAYKQVMELYPDGTLSVLSRSSLLDIAKTAGDEETLLTLLEDLVYKTKRTDQSRSSCESASRDLARYYFRKGDSANAVKSLATSYKGGTLDHYTYEYGAEGIRHLRPEEDTKPLAKKLGSELIAIFEKSIPSSLTEDANKSVARNCLNRIAGVYGNLGESDQVLKTYERIGKMLGVTDGLLGQIATHYKSIGERDKARETYRKYKDQKAAKNAIAYMFREERKYDEAIKLYRELVQEDADRVASYLWAIAECFEAKGDWKNAIQTFRQTDRFPTSYLRMAGCHRRLKQWKEALSLYNQVKSVDQHAPEAAYQIGHTYEQAGQRENAIKAFQLTCRSYPKSGYASRAHAHLQTKYNITATFGGAKDE